ncbi:MAG: tRNA-guanine transglycosylase [Hyphomicrobiales bacterium]
MQGGDNERLRLASAAARRHRVFMAMPSARPRRRRAAGNDASGAGLYLPGVPRTGRAISWASAPDDIVSAVARGIDMFDCVMPTRNARHGLAFTRHGKVNLKNARHADDPRPLDETSNCPATSLCSHAYLHHLIKANGRSARCS